MVLLDDGNWGAPFILAALQRSNPTMVWIELDPGQQGDPVAQGNRFSEAVTRALGGPLFGTGMPFGYGLAVVAAQRRFLAPLTVVLSGADYGTDFAAALLELQGHGVKVVLQAHGLDLGFAFPAGTLVLGPAELRLSRPEAAALVADSISEADLDTLLDATSGGLDAILQDLAGLLSVATPSGPSPSAANTEALTDAGYQTLADHLVGHGEWLQALELTVERDPGRVGEMLDIGDDYLWYLGSFERLFQLLSRLEVGERSDPTILRWLLTAALELGRPTTVLGEVAAALSTSDDPELRATYAEALERSGDLPGALDHSDQAAAAKRTPLTLAVRGHLLELDDPERGVEDLRAALRLAEARENDYWTSFASARLSQGLVAVGCYGAAADYADWGLQLHGRQQYGNSGLWLKLLTQAGFSRIMLDRVAGLESQLRQAAEATSNVHVEIGLRIRSTLAHLLMSEGRTGEALEIYGNLWQSNRHRNVFGTLAPFYVRALLEAGAHAEALEIAQQAANLTEDLPLVYRRGAQLAGGMTMSMMPDPPGTVVTQLEGAVAAFQQPLLAPQRAQAALFLARVQLKLGDEPGARQTLTAAGPIMLELGRPGLRLLAGPSASFAELLALLRSPRATLGLHFLDGPRVRFRGEPVNLRRRFLEILAALALHPEGLSAEQLALAVYGEAADPATATADITKLRRLIPIASRPYRLDLDVWADFTEVSQLLAGGKAAEALRLYRHPLLVASESPAIAAHRDLLEETLRRAALTAGDAGVLLDLAQRLGDDLEIWEAVLAALPPNDPRRVGILARVERVRNDYDISG